MDDLLNVNPKYYIDTVFFIIKIDIIFIYCYVSNYKHINVFYKILAHSL